jgi:FkbM family methyltransferase
MTYFIKILVYLLRLIGQHIPNISLVRAIPNRILKPIHLQFNRDIRVVDVLGFKMKLDPAECVDGNLYFSPQLYDKNEIMYLIKKMPKDGVFVDVGGNIGFWGLYFSSILPKSKIFVIEANPDTCNVLRENISLNRFSNITLINVGVSDECGKMDLWCNDDGNRGADSFLGVDIDMKRSISVIVKPLFQVLLEAGASRMDVMKIDIEGFELKVLTKFFLDAPHELWPRFICVEVSHDNNVIFALENLGYKNLIAVGENCVFELIDRTLH